MSGPSPVPVLMYHAVTETPAPAVRELSVTPRAFTGQLAVLADRGFTPLTTAALAAAWRDGGPLPAKPVLITFDDGYEGVHRYALPALVRHGFPATLFVTTGWLRGPYGTGGGPNTMLDWDQVRRLAAAGVEIGGHSHRHPPLDGLTDDRLRREVLRCKEIVTAETGAAPESFAYPYGHSSRRVRQLVRGLGFRQALAVRNALADRRQGPYALARLTVRRGTGPEEFARLVEGRGISRAFARDRALTKGYAVVRRTRQAARRLRPDGRRDPEDDN
ncbi:polysaccharide deacetylase family protein [Streptomyces kasugaensis]|uniref:Polysaccharide deacetylase family protein n=1 Tax=Streptomyces kasugaensis TaxID=1946 RepID=A0A4Q9HN49_STRKA|nr:polysaccharide deacetylase family protein [Streptomyces kasugaensis]TBO56256.1 polysaccharide deacetylase family protein [Streptomyces kasugaensis]